MRLASVVVALVALVTSAIGVSLPSGNALEARQSTEKYVFAHFVLGIVASYQQGDWESDMVLAKTIGIDGFALDIGKDSYTTQQLEYAYAAAAAVGFKVFISFDFSYYDNGDVDTIASILQQFQGEEAQFVYQGAPFVSTFIGDGFPWTSVESISGDLFTCPNWQPGSLGDANSDCGFSWQPWPSTNNQPIDANQTTAVDEQYISALGSKPYMMPVSPWFFTHYGVNSYNKNWIFYSDYLWQPRWEQVLQLAPPLVEIVTWNDFSESHYIGPLHPNDPSVYAGDPVTGAVEWVTNMPHDAWRDVATLYIAAYKAGASAPTVDIDELVYYYRPTPKNTVCSDSVPPPTGYEDDDDSIFVVAMLTEAGTVTVNSGPNTLSYDLDAGINTVGFPMGVGSQTFTLSRNGMTVVTGTGGINVSDSCTVYNFNAYTGSIIGPVGGGGSSPPQVTVTFYVKVTTTHRQQVYVVGSTDQLGNWDPNSGIGLSSMDYTPTDPLWLITLSLSASTETQYKFCIINENGTVTWEAGPDRNFTTPAKGSVQLHDVWQSS